MLATVGAVLLLAAPVKVAVPGYTTAGLDSAVAAGYADHFVALLGRDGRLKLTTQSDIAQVLGLERQKQLLGCADDGSSCLAELAGALGVDAILSITLVKSGTNLTATLRMLRATDGKEVAAASARFKNEDALQDWLEAQADDFAARAEAAFGGPAAPSFARWVPAILGGAALVAGGTLYGLSRAGADRLRTGTFANPDDVHATASMGRTFEGAGVGLMIGGGVAVAASILWVALAPSGGRVAFFAGPDGAGFRVMGSF